MRRDQGIWSPGYSWKSTPVRDYVQAPRQHGEGRSHPVGSHAGHHVTQPADVPVRAARRAGPPVREEEREELQERARHLVARLKKSELAAIAKDGEIARAQDTSMESLEKLRRQDAKFKALVKNLCKIICINQKCCNKSIAHCIANFVIHFLKLRHKSSKMHRKLQYDTG